MNLGPATGKLPTCSTPHYSRIQPDPGAAAAPDPLSHTSCTIALQVSCALRQLRPDSVAHVELQYCPQEARFSRVAGALLDVCQADTAQVVLDSHPFREYAAAATGAEPVPSGWLPRTRPSPVPQNMSPAENM